MRLARDLHPADWFLAAGGPLAFCTEQRPVTMCRARGALPLEGIFFSPEKNTEPPQRTPDMAYQGRVIKNRAGYSKVNTQLGINGLQARNDDLGIWL